MSTGDQDQVSRAVDFDYHEHFPAILYHKCLAVLQYLCLRAKDMISPPFKSSQLENELTRLYLWGEYFESGTLRSALQASREVEIDVIDALRNIGAAVLSLSSTCYWELVRSTGVEENNTTKFNLSLRHLLREANAKIAESERQESNHIVSNFSGPTIEGDDFLDIDDFFDPEVDLCDEIHFHTDCLMQYAPLLRDNLSRLAKDFGQKRFLAHDESSSFRRQIMNKSGQFSENVAEHQIVLIAAESEVADQGLSANDMSLEQPSTADLQRHRRAHNKSDFDMWMAKQMMLPEERITKISSIPSTSAPESHQARGFGDSHNVQPYFYKDGKTWLRSDKETQPLHADHGIEMNSMTQKLVVRDYRTDEVWEFPQSDAISRYREVVDTTQIDQSYIDRLERRRLAAMKNREERKKRAHSDPFDMPKKKNYVERTVPGKRKKGTTLGFATAENPERTYKSLLRSELNGDEVNRRPEQDKSSQQNSTASKSPPLRTSSSLIPALGSKKSGKATEPEEQKSRIASPKADDNDQSTKQKEEKEHVDSAKADDTDQSTECEEETKPPIVSSKTGNNEQPTESEEEPHVLSPKPGGASAGLLGLLHDLDGL